MSADTGYYIQIHNPYHMIKQITISGKSSKLLKAINEFMKLKNIILEVTG